MAHERFHHEHPRVRRKMEALWLKSQGLAHQEIARLAGVSGNTLRSYLQQYAEGGIAGLKELHFRQPKSELAGIMEQPPQPPGGRPGANDFFRQAHSMSPATNTLVRMTYPREPLR